MVKVQDEITCLARTLAPEDIRPGRYIAVLHETIEFVRLCFDSAIDQPPKRIRVQFLPDDGEAGVPLKVIAVSLPFVFVKDPHGRHRTLDVRRFAFAELPKEYARAVREAIKAQRKREAKSAKCE